MNISNSFNGDDDSTGMAAKVDMIAWSIQGMGEICYVLETQEEQLSYAVKFTSCLVFKLAIEINSNS